MFDVGCWMFSNFPRAAGNRLVHDVADLTDLINAHEAIHFGHQLGKFLAKALREAARNDDRLAASARVAQFDGFENGVHALFLRGINEGAGVHDDGVSSRGVIGNLHAALE